MREVTAAIIIKDATVLIARRAPTEKLAGYWEFPGGKIEAGESPQECLEREMKEELAVEVKADSIIATSEYIYDHGAIRLLGITASLISEQFLLSVHDQLKWVKLTDLLNYTLAPADIDLAKQIQEVFNHDIQN